MGRDFFDNNQTVSLGEWILAYLVMMIPILNLIFLLKWAIFGAGSKQSKQTWAQCALIFLVISTILTVLCYGSLYMQGILPLSH